VSCTHHALYLICTLTLHGSIILVGLLISYLPQHYRIISRGTSEGISPYFVLLGTTSATAGFANILTVAPSRNAIGCCKELETFECAAGLLGVAQLGTQWMCFTAMYVDILCPMSILLTNRPNFFPIAALYYSSFSSDIARLMCLKRSLPGRVLDGKRLPPWVACASYTDWL
jgi:hypothetical protein